MIHPLGIGIVIGNRRMAEEVRGCLEDLPVNILFRQPDMPDVPRFLEYVQRFHPDVLLIELAVLPKPFDDVLRQIRQTPVAPLIIAFGDSADAETILTAVRGGAGEYLYSPLAAGLQKALERMSEERARTSHGRIGGRTLGFLSSKGGCGATTVACHVAAALQRATDKEVLLADFDLDCGMVGFLMKAQMPYSVADAAMNTHRLDLSYWKALVTSAGPNLDVISAPQWSAPRQGPLQQQEFRKVLRFLRSAYDWAVVDLGRSLEAFSVNLLEELDEAFLISNLDLPSLHMTKQILQVLIDSGYNRDRIRLVLNRMPKKPDISPAEVERLLSLPIYAVLPDDNTEMHEAMAHGELVPAGSALGRQLEKLAQKIAGGPGQSPAQPVLIQ